MSTVTTSYARVSTSIWQSAKHKRWTLDATLLALYLLTNKSRRMEGLYELPLDYIKADLPGKWTKPKLVRALNVLRESGFARYDERAEVVFICHALVYQCPETPNHIKAGIHHLRNVPDTTLWNDFHTAVSAYAPGNFAAAIEEAFADRKGNDITDGITHTHTLYRNQSSSSQFSSSFTSTKSENHTRNSGSTSLADSHLNDSSVNSLADFENYTDETILAGEYDDEAAAFLAAPGSTMSRPNCMAEQNLQRQYDDELEPDL